MSKVIFVDIDGPLIPMRAAYLPKQTTIYSVFDPCAASLLNRLLSTDENISMVISSTWRFKGRAEIVKLLRKNKIDPKRLHKDWKTPTKMSSTRAMEINMWRRDHPEVTHYTCLEDESLDINEVPCAVKCDTYEGFSWRNYLECQVHLDSYVYPDEGQGQKHQRFLDTIDYFKRREIWRTVRYGDPKGSLASEMSLQLIPMYEQPKDE